MTSRFEPNWRVCSRMAIVSGAESGRANTRATSMSFHTQRNWKIISDAIAGSPRGSTTRKNTVSSPAPSMRAASSRSRGMPAKKLRSRKIANGSPNATWKRITPSTSP
jgi:hypothetical protein